MPTIQYDFTDPRGLLPGSRIHRYVNGKDTILIEDGIKGASYIDPRTGKRMYTQNYPLLKDKLSQDGYREGVLLYPSNTRQVFEMPDINRIISEDKFPPYTVDKNGRPTINIGLPNEAKKDPKEVETYMKSRAIQKRKFGGRVPKAFLGDNTNNWTDYERQLSANMPVEDEAPLMAQNEITRRSRTKPQVGPRYYPAPPAFPLLSEREYLRPRVNSNGIYDGTDTVTVDNNKRLVYSRDRYNRGVGVYDGNRRQGYFVPKSHKDYPKYYQDAKKAGQPSYSWYDPRGWFN